MTSKLHHDVTHFGSHLKCQIRFLFAFVLRIFWHQLDIYTMCCSWVINDYVFFTISVTLTIDLFPWYFSTMQVYDIRPKLNEVIVWYWAVDTHIHTQTNTSITITSLCEIKYGPILTTLYIVKSHRSGTEHHTNTRLVPRYSWKRRQVILGFDIGYGHTFCSPYWWWRCYLARLGILWNMHFNLKRTRALKRTRYLPSIPYYSCIFDPSVPVSPALFSSSDCSRLITGLLSSDLSCSF